MNNYCMQNGSVAKPSANGPQLVYLFLKICTRKPNIMLPKLSQKQSLCTTIIESLQHCLQKNCTGSQIAFSPDPRHHHSQLCILSLPFQTYSANFSLTRSQLFATILTLNRAPVLSLIIHLSVVFLSPLFRLSQRLP